VTVDDFARNPGKMLIDELTGDGRTDDKQGVFDFMLCITHKVRYTPFCARPSVTHLFIIHNTESLACRLVL